MSNRKSPFAIIIGIFLILTTVLFVFSNFETIRYIFESTGSGSLSLKASIVASLGIYAILSIAAFVSARHKAAMFGLTLFLGVYTLYYTVVITTNPGVYFSFSTPQRIAELVAYLLIDVSFTLSIVHLAVFKAFRSNNAPQPVANQYQQQQYQPQPEPEQKQEDEGFYGYREDNNKNNDVGSF